MKKTFYLITILFFSVLLQAQNCKLKEDKDKLTGEKIRGISVRSARDKTATLYQQGNSYFLTIIFLTRGEINDYFKKGEKAQLKLKNGFLIEVHLKEKSTPQTTLYASSYSASVQTQFTLHYKITEENLAELAMSPITVTRIYNEDHQFDLEYDNKKMEKIMNGAKCMLKY